MFKKMLVALSWSSLCLSPAFLQALDDQADLKNGRSGVYKDLTVYNTLKTNNHYAHESQIDGIITAARLALVNSSIELSSGGNLLDYGYFYSQNTGAINNVLLTPSTTTSSYTALTNACGVTVSYAGTYLVYVYIWGPNNSSWTLNLNGTAITGATFSNSYPSAGADSSATGLAIVTVPTNGGSITITGSNLAEPQGSIPLNFGIIRLQ